MNWKNTTKVQHFISQVEQRLNAINPNALAKNQRIYEFEITDREKFEISLSNQNGRHISSSLAYLDLFSFDVEKEMLLRNNFENAFNRYEVSIKSLTENLISKVTSGQSYVIISDEVVNLFVVKLLNFIRNPFSIRKVLNTFGILTNYLPALPEHQEPFNRILEGRKPHQARLCEEFGITDIEYEQWLRMLFMLFIPSGDADLNMLERIVKSYFISYRFEIAVLVSIYSSPQCLLSDRSFSTNVDSPGVDSYDFNLTSRAFIRYMFANIDTIVPPNTPIEVLDRYKENLRKTPPQIKCHYFVDNMELLAGFNRNVIYQSSRHVYCASKIPFVI